MGGVGPLASSLLPPGAFPEPGGTWFRVHAPGHSRVELVLESGAGAGRTLELRESAPGQFETRVDGVVAGDRYRYRLDGAGPFPDPASRFQPDGVDGAAEVIDPAAFAWNASDWRGRPLAELVIYELHVGTFTPAGTFAAAIEKLAHVSDLGVTAIELMPLHDFPGERNWGYDPGALFAPPRCYGRPDDLRRLIDAAHGRGLAVLLDVVYNHVGPRGAYVARFNRRYLTPRHSSPWGAGVDLDGEGSVVNREFIVHNLMHWLTDYRVDGFRLDATQALRDEGELHLLQELGVRARAGAPDRHVVLICEDDRNWNRVVTPVASRGLGMDAQWSFDVHHQLHVLLTGERHGYYVDFRPSARDLATTLRQGWLFTGQPSAYKAGEPRGTDPAGIAPERFVVYAQSHDETGNRPLGDRLHDHAGADAHRAALAPLLLGPHTPMLFMGEEWQATSPFRFFTDHPAALGKRIAASRRKWFSGWPGFETPVGPERIPDPQELDTFLASKLRWEEPAREPHAGMLRYVRRLLELRRTEPALQRGPAATFDVTAPNDAAIVLTRSAPGTPALAVVAALGPEPMSLRLAGGWHTVLTSEDQEFVANAQPVAIVGRSEATEMAFSRRGAIVLRSRS